MNLLLPAIVSAANFHSSCIMIHVCAFFVVLSLEQAYLSLLPSVLDAVALQV
jgi:hypothetical protein